MNHQEAINTIDAQIVRITPELKKGYYLTEVWERIDILLDIRFELAYQMGLVAMNNELDLIFMEQEAYLL